MSKSIYTGKKRGPGKSKFQSHTNQICNYGCNKEAHYQFKNKKWCCSSISNKCPAKIKRFRKTGNNVESNGLTKFQNGAANRIEQLRNDIDETGTNGLQRKARKAIRTQQNKIEDNGKSQLENKMQRQREISRSAMLASVAKRKNDIENGLNAYQRNNLIAAKAARTNIQPNGLSSFENGQIKRCKILNKKDKNGKTGWEKLNEKATKSLSIKDENGLDGWDRGFITSLSIKSHPKIGISIQSKNEEKFIDEWIEKYGIKWCKENIGRGPNTKFVCPISGKTRVYKPDFLIRKTIYEIKSSWTWNRKGNCMESEQINKAKLDKMKELGFTVVLVLDYKEIDW